MTANLWPQTFIETTWTKGYLFYCWVCECGYRGELHKESNLTILEAATHIETHCDNDRDTLYERHDTRY